MPQDDQSGTYDRREFAATPTDVLAGRVISALNETKLRNSDGTRQILLDLLVCSVLSADPFEAKQMFAELRGHGLSADTILDIYIPNAARDLGQKWVEDKISFAAVTIGTLRLQSLLDQVVLHPHFESNAATKHLRAIVVLPPGEQHFLGVNVVAAQLRRIGCDVSISFDETPETLTSRVTETQPDVVLITCSRNESLSTISATVRAIRRAGARDPLIALGGAITRDTENLEEQTGVDLVSNSAKAAAAACMRRSRILAPR
ncbi:hypothetical protein ROLI_002460 [Roseobacter fucihabitans]|uniref:B12-binding domain-containing protein n=1 Tax=Roseobacter fucihabitans TaxID=1537242 RepID=A0ABZ2BMK6_9RHOB|nr:cobalamin B12-binding domain-containing protein [Roseobacter litoralis]MBC6963497.1 B12 binding domain protein [Roseobacter litoralis]